MAKDSAVRSGSDFIISYSDGLAKPYVDVVDLSVKDVGNLIQSGRLKAYSDPEDPSNALTRSEALDHADWTKSGSSTSADGATGPDGATSLDEIIEDVNNTQHFVRQDVSGATANANYALSAWASANNRSWVRLSVFDTGNGSNRVRVWFDLSSGAVGSNSAGGTGSFVRAYMKDWTDVASNLHRCILVGSVGNNATSIGAKISLATGDNVVTYDGDGSSSLHAGYAQFEDDREFASPYVQTVASAV